MREAKIESKSLPDVPSELIEVALHDLESVERDERYVVKMLDWHQPLPFHSICNVCLAGSVMAKTLNVPPREKFSPCDFPDMDTENKILALNEFRRGYTGKALSLMGYGLPRGVDDISNVRGYHSYRKGFFEDMRDLISRLREAGL